MSGLIKFSPRLRELRVHLCSRTPTSDGAREFLNKHYLSLKQTNPNCPILVRECNGIQPKLWARFENGKEDVMSLFNKNSEEIFSQFKTLVTDSLPTKI